MTLNELFRSATTPNPNNNNSGIGSFADVAPPARKSLSATQIPDVASEQKRRRGPPRRAPVTPPAAPEDNKPKRRPGRPRKHPAQVPAAETRHTVAKLPPVPAVPVPMDMQLESITQKALMKAQEILDRPFDPDNGTLARAQASVINSALVTQVRVDESRLRARETDTLAKLIELMNQEAAKLPPRSPE